MKNKYLFQIIFLLSAHLAAAQTWQRTYGLAGAQHLEQTSDEGFWIYYPDSRLRTNADGDSLYLEAWTAPTSPYHYTYVSQTAILTRYNDAGDTLWSILAGHNIYTSVYYSTTGVVYVLYNEPNQTNSAAAYWVYDTTGTQIHYAVVNGPNNINSCSVHVKIDGSALLSTNSYSGFLPQGAATLYSTWSLFDPAGHIACTASGQSGTYIGSYLVYDMAQTPLGACGIYRCEMPPVNQPGPSPGCYVPCNGTKYPVTLDFGKTEMIGLQDGGFAMIGSIGWPVTGTLLSRIYCNSVLPFRKITGTTFHDSNGNCMLDSLDTSLANVKVSVENSNFQTYSDSTGHFTLNVTLYSNAKLKMEADNLVMCEYSATINTISSDVNDVMLLLRADTITGTQEAKDIITSLQPRISPNPSNDDFIVDLNLPGTMEVSIDVYNVLGRSVANASQKKILQKGKQQMQIDASQWSAGTYWLRLKSSNKSCLLQLVKA